MTEQDTRRLAGWLEKNKDHKITFLEKEAVKLVLRKAETVNDLIEAALKLLPPEQ